MAKLTHRGSVASVVDQSKLALVADCEALWDQRRARDHPGAGAGYLVDAYTVNHRATTSTTPHTQQAATTSPATIEGLTNGTKYHIFVTATNTSATSNPSTTITATPASSSTARGPGGFTDTNATSAHTAAITELAATNTGTLGRHGIELPPVSWRVGLGGVGRTEAH